MRFEPLKLHLFMELCFDLFKDTILVQPARRPATQFYCRFLFADFVLCILLTLFRVLSVVRTTFMIITLLSKVVCIFVGIFYIRCNFLFCIRYASSHTWLTPHRITANEWWLWWCSNRVMRLYRFRILLTDAYAQNWLALTYNDCWVIFFFIASYCDLLILLLLLLLLLHHIAIA